MRLSPARPGFKSRRGNHFLAGAVPSSTRIRTARRCKGIYEFRGSIVVSIPACHAGDPGSIPGLGVNFFDLRSNGQPDKITHHAQTHNTTQLNTTQHNTTQHNTTHSNAQKMHHRPPHQKKKGRRFYRDLNPDYKDQNLGC